MMVRSGRQTDYDEDMQWGMGIRAAIEGGKDWIHGRGV